MKAGINYIYANSRAAVLSKNLISQEKFVRMIDADSYSDAVRILSDSGYNIDVNKTLDLDKVLRDEEIKSIQFFEDMMTVDTCSKVFLLPYDFLNAKIAMKCKYMRKAMPDNLISGIIDSKKLFESINKDDYRELPAEMRNALEKIDEQFVDGNRAPSVIDNILDMAKFECLNNLKKHCGSKYVRDYITADADITNMLLRERYKRAGLNSDNGFAVGGNISQEKFFETENMSDMMKDDFYKATPYYNLYKLILKNASIGILEAEANHIKHDIMYSARANDGIEPLVVYYLSKKAEIANVRLILTGKKSNIDNAVLTQRMKEMYV